MVAVAHIVKFALLELEKIELHLPSFCRNVTAIFHWLKMAAILNVLHYGDKWVCLLQLVSFSQSVIQISSLHSLLATCYTRTLFGLLIEQS